jgi:GTP cyclohydrolase I
VLSPTVDGSPSGSGPSPGTNGAHRNGDATPAARPADERADRATAEAAVGDLLRWLGEDPEREGLQGTPRRVVDALREMTEGYDQDPAEILATRFEEDHDDLVAVRGVAFSSLCEHHLLPVEGRATVAYLPDGEVVGLSKLSRLVQAFADRLQVQERMTRQIADALDEHVAPRGTAVVVEAEHACMSLRGVQTPAEMVTTAFRGALDTPEMRRRVLDQADAARPGAPRP